MEGGYIRFGYEIKRFKGKMSQKKEKLVVVKVSRQSSLSSLKFRDAA